MFELLSLGIIGVTYVIMGVILSFTGYIKEDPGETIYLSFISLMLAGIGSIAGIALLVKLLLLLGGSSV